MPELFRGNNLQDSGGGITPRILRGGGVNNPDNPPYLRNCLLISLNNVQSLKSYYTLEMVRKLFAEIKNEMICDFNMNMQLLITHAKSMQKKSFLCPIL